MRVNSAPARYPASPLALLALLGGLLVAPEIGRSFSADSYSYAQLAESLRRDGSYATATLRDFLGPLTLPQPSRSFPPLWPLTLAAAQVITGAGILAGLLPSLLLLGALPLAVWRFGVRLAPPGLGPWLLAMAAAFLCWDEGFRNEIASARAIPLAMLLGWLLLTQLLQPLWPPTVGLTLAALALTRFDQLPFAVAVLLALGMQRRWRPTVAAVVLFFLAMAPWWWRNLAVFGTPLASDNAPTVRSLHAGIVQVSWFAPGQVPQTLAEAPWLWLVQRAGYAWRAIATLGFVALPAWLALAAGLILHGSLLPLRRRWLLWPLLHALATLAAVALTPYGDRRYFAPVHLEVAVVAAVVLAEVPWAQRWPRLAQPLPRFLVATAFGAMIVTAVARIAAEGPGIWQVAQMPQSAMVTAAKDTLAGQSGVLVAAVDAERFSFLTGLQGVTLPVNAPSDGPAFQAWLLRFQPSHLLLATGDPRAEAAHLRRPATALPEGFVLVPVQPFAAAPALARRP